jgi:hypothetical protein
MMLYKLCLLQKGTPVKFFGLNHPLEDSPCGKMCGCQESLDACSSEDMLTIKEGGTFAHPSLCGTFLVQCPVDAKTHEFRPVAGKIYDFRPGFPVVLLIRPQAEIS